MVSLLGVISLYSLNHLWYVEYFSVSLVVSQEEQKYVEYK